MNKIYKNNIVELLRELSNKEYQIKVWTNIDNTENLIGSFDEAVNMLFCDCIIEDLLEDGEIMFDQATTHALQELSDAVDVVDESHPQAEIINDPLMQIVREKAAKALALVKASDGSESTVEIIE